MDGVVVPIYTAEKAATPNSANVTKLLSPAQSVPLSNPHPAFGRLLPLTFRPHCLFPATHDVDHPSVARLVQEAAGATAALNTTGVVQARVCFCAIREDFADESRPLCCGYLSKGLWKMYHRQFGQG
jgi:hypothetical protein